MVKPTQSIQTPTQSTPPKSKWYTKTTKRWKAGRGKFNFQIDSTAKKLATYCTYNPQNNVAFFQIVVKSTLVNTYNYNPKWERMTHTNLRRLFNLQYTQRSVFVLNDIHKSTKAPHTNIKFHFYLTLPDKPSEESIYKAVNICEQAVRDQEDEMKRADGIPEISLQ